MLRFASRLMKNGLACATGGSPARYRADEAGPWGWGPAAFREARGHGIGQIAL